jgi:hypothetical protein
LYILNGKTEAASPNAYPLSEKQLTDGIKQLNIQESYASSGLLQTNDKLKCIVERYDKKGIGKFSKKYFYYPSLVSKNLLKRRNEILVDALNDAVGVIFLLFIALFTC